MATVVKENTKYNLIPANSSQNNLNAFFNLCFSPFVLAGFGGGLVQQLILMLGSGNASCTAGSALTWLPCAAQVAAYQTILDTCAKGGSNITTGLHIVTRVGVVGRSRG